MKINPFKLRQPGILVYSCLLLSVLFFAACGKEEESSNTGTKNTNPAVESDYILFNGYKMILRKPRLWKIGVNAGDTVLNWAGSLGGSGDTAIQFRHAEGIKGGANAVVQDALDLGEVGILINWGVPGVNPEIQLTSGDYKIERINKRWVSTLKNGKGVWEKSSGNVNYSGIEVRVTWPEF
jgi:hypothetical protein